jgi:integrase
MPRKLKTELDALTVKNAAPGRYADGGGLNLVVKPTGARSWIFRYMLRGISREMGLGPAAGSDAVSLADARELARAHRAELKAGKDPLLERNRKAAEAAAQIQAAAVAGTSFEAEAARYIAANRHSWRNPKHRQQWENTLSAYVYPVIGKMPVAEVGKAHVLQVIEPIWRDKPETASRIRGRIETILDAATARDLRTGENPARWRGHLAHILPKRTRLSRGHHKAMAYGDVPTFVSKLRTRRAMAALALEFVILTAARSGEVVGATWGEIDLIRKVWTIPAHRMKAAKEHRVPLSPRAVEILEAMRQPEAVEADFVFAGEGGGKLSAMAMAMLLRRMGIDATVHGFRSSFRDWASECTAFAHEVAEMALAHTVESKVERAYRRGDLFEKRARLMSDWAVYCGGGGSAGATVTPIRREARS